jgi:tetratricopeptide (TPR) repeat protein
VFPGWLYESKEDYLTVMGFYNRAVSHAWDEFYHHHIDYRFTVQDLLDDAVFALGAIQVKYGNLKQAQKILELMFRKPRGDLAAETGFLLARVYEKMGDFEKAQARYAEILQYFPDGGLADDAQAELARLQQGQAGGEWCLVGEGPLSDVYYGQYVTVQAPPMLAAKMREYNLPNIWDQAYANLQQWTGLQAYQKQLILVDESVEGGQPGFPVRLSARAIQDPPTWNLGLRELAYNFVSNEHYGVIGSVHPALREAFASFAAAALQYSLVSETRDTIGSAAATKLAHEDVINRRRQALEALHRYIQSGALLENLTPDVALGMLVQLLDQNGYGNNELIDWSPYQRFWMSLLRLPPERRMAGGDPAQSAGIVVQCLNAAFNTDLTPTFQAWGFPVSPEQVRTSWQPTGMKG